MATPLNASTALERSGWFARVRRTRIGSPYVIEAMARLAAEGARLPVGYEANGGFLLGGTAVSAGGRRLEPLPTRDAHAPDRWRSSPRPAREGLAALRARRRPAGPRRPPATGCRRSTSGGRGAAPRRARGETGRPHRAPLAARGRSVSPATDTLDGVRMTLASGEIVHLRLSGNAPELRCYAEAATPERAAALMAGMLARVERMLR